jgi:hypothetical protein
MSIAEFIRESVLRSRLKQSGCLVVYDAVNDHQFEHQLTPPFTVARFVRI